MSAAQLEARRKAGLSTSDPTHACSGAISNAKPDCEEKRDPDKRSLIIQKKKNELDPDTQLEKRTFAAPSAKDGYADKVAVRWMTWKGCFRPIGETHGSISRHSCTASHWIFRLNFLPKLIQALNMFFCQPDGGALRMSIIACV